MESEWVSEGESTIGSVNVDGRNLGRNEYEEELADGESEC